MFWGSKERDRDALCSFFGVLPSLLQCICFVGSLQLTGEAVGASVGGVFSSCSRIFTNCMWLQSPTRRAKAGAAAENQYKGGGFSNPPQRNEADRLEDGSKPAHGPENVNFSFLMMSWRTSKMLFPSERQSQPKSQTHRGRHGPNLHIKAPLRRQSGGFIPIPA